jgi:hypothetical protein
VRLLVRAPVTEFWIIEVCDELPPALPSSAFGERDGYRCKGFPVSITP